MEKKEGVPIKIRRCFANIVIQFVANALWKNKRVATIVARNDGTQDPTKGREDLRKENPLIRRCVPLTKGILYYA